MPKCDFNKVAKHISRPAFDKNNYGGLLELQVKLL